MTLPESGVAPRRKALRRIVVSCALLMVVGAAAWLILSRRVNRSAEPEIPSTVAPMPSMPEISAPSAPVMAAPSATSDVSPVAVPPSLVPPPAPPRAPPPSSKPAPVPRSGCAPSDPLCNPGVSGSHSHDDLY